MSYIQHGTTTTGGGECGKRGGPAAHVPVDDAASRRRRGGWAAGDESQSLEAKDVGEIAAAVTAADHRKQPFDYHGGRGGGPAAPLRLRPISSGYCHHVSYTPWPIGKPSLPRTAGSAHGPRPPAPASPCTLPDVDRPPVGRQQRHDASLLVVHHGRVSCPSLPELRAPARSRGSPTPDPGGRVRLHVQPPTAGSRRPSSVIPSNLRTVHPG